MADWMYLSAIGVGVLVFAVLAMLGALAKWYRKASADEALIRTGRGGKEVRIDRGILVIPLLHEVSRVSLSTIRLHVQRVGRRDSVVTKDKIRANVIAEFYLRVQPDPEAVLKAARSLGARGMSADSMKELFEGKVTDVLRSVAANKTFNELHMHRKTFAEEVKNQILHDLEENGFKLESVAITNLEQTPLEDLDPNDVFDAEGARMITEVVQRMAEEKNRIVRDKENEILEKNVEATQRSLTLSETQKRAEADQQMRVRAYEAAKTAEAVKAELEKAEETEKAQLAKARAVHTAKIENEQLVQERQIKQAQAIAIQQAEKNRQEQIAKIEAEKAIKVADIERAKVLEAEQIVKEQVIETANIEKVKAVEAAELEKRIVIASKQAENLRAEASREAANAEREAAAQNVIATAARAIAEREKAVALIKADEEAQKQVIEARGQASKAAEEAKGHAEALANEAEGKARAIREQARAEADAAALRAAAILALAKADNDKGLMEAAVRRAFVEADNSRSVPAMVSEAVRDLIHKSPEIVHELMKPAEKISDLKILQMNGFPGSANNTVDAQTGMPLGSTFSQLASTLMQAGAAYPMFKELLSFAKTAEGEKIVNVVREEVERLTAGNGNGGSGHAAPTLDSAPASKAS
jgi:flotillin